MLHNEGVFQLLASGDLPHHGTAGNLSVFLGGELCSLFVKRKGEEVRDYSGHEMTAKLH